MIEDSFIESHVVREGGKNIVARFMGIFVLLAAILAVNIFGVAKFDLVALPVTLTLSVTLVFIFVTLFKRSYAEYDVEISNDNVNVAKILGRAAAWISWIFR